MTSPFQPPCRVMLVGGPAGVGKSSLAYRLAERLRYGITEVDDLHLVVHTLTTPEQQPVLHYWDTHPECFDWSAEQILDLQLQVCRVMAPAVEAVIANHVEDGPPIVLEGDYLLPESALRPAPREAVGAVFLYEPDEAQIVRNFAVREPEAGAQTKRARVSWLFGQWLKAECERLGVAVAEARPWDTLLERSGLAVG